ncbi:MAG: Proteasome subunit beta [Candidatus Woesearchaeota archaeon]|nr:Proteasome subunit beta [Candidatus Woesearchaeota archaeon]
MKEETLKTGTTTVGIVCKDGIVLAADKRATSGNLVVDKNAQKIHSINDNLVLTTAGSVSDIQLLIKLIKAQLKLKQLKTNRDPNIKESANLLSGIVYSNVRKMSMIPGVSHFVLGGKDKFGFHLYDLFADGSLTLCEEYIASGSGSVMAYGVLETLYEKELSVKKCIELAVKAINAAVQRDTASGQGIDVVTVTDKGVETVLKKKINTKL